MQLMDKEFQYNMELAKAQSGVQREIDEAKEKAKDKRVSIQSTQQSQLINQRKNDTPPINFESTEDSMDGFSLAQFEPR
jgi:hypothetical protein